MEKEEYGGNKGKYRKWYERVEGRESVREGDTWSITFWNVAGI